MKRTSVAIFALLSALLSAIAPASAADLYGNSTKDPITSSFSFLPTGAYVSIGLGGALTDTSANQGTVNPDFNFAGFLGEARIGYDTRYGNWVAGPLVGISFEDVKGRTDLDSKLTTGNQVFGYELGGRLGYVFNGTSLGYVLLAYEGQHVGLDNTGFTADLSGVKVGTGLEVDLGNKLFFGSEVDYVWFGDWSPVSGVSIGENELRATLRFGLRVN